MLVKDYAVACSNCHRSAIAQQCDEPDEIMVTCFRCGYNYSKKIEKIKKGTIEYLEESYGGFGVLKLVTQDGDVSLGQFRHSMTKKQYNDFKEAYFHEETNRDESYLATYENGKSTVHYGEPSANFYLSFSQYKEKIMNKYEENELQYPFLPFEE